MKILNTKTILFITAFISGALVMIMELTAARIIAPYVGSSFFVWTNLIGVVLGSLSLGYYIGGRISQKPTLTVLGFITTALSVWILTISFVSQPLLEAFSDIRGLDVQTASLLSIIALFAVPSMLFGTISPYIAKLLITSVKDSGKTVGNLYAVSTLGSIFGTFITGFVLISVFKSLNILILMSTLLAANSITLFYLDKNKKGMIAGFALIVVSLTSIYFAAETGLIETNYNTVEIYESQGITASRAARYMILSGVVSSGVFLDGKGLAFPYFEYYDLAHHFNPSFKKTLMIGGAGFVYPTYLVGQNKDVIIDVVEIDPELKQIAKEKFGLRESDRLKVIHEDGRVYLNKNQKTYDVIYMDAYSAYSIPFHLVTGESALKMKESLSPDGVVIMNVISAATGDKSKVLSAIYKTFSNVFPHVNVFLVASPQNPAMVQNIILTAANNDVALESSNPYFSRLLSHRINFEAEDNISTLTDQYAPIDQYLLPLYQSLKM